MQKPSYRTSKLAIWLSSFLAWLVILALTAGAVASGQVIAFAQIALPMMVGLIAVMLGIHRGLGSLDMWTMTRSPALPSSSYHPRDDPKENGR
ncbi:NAD(P)+ transhydrogenase beta chain [Pseudorhizobium halotolerans]|uniref:NAD(P)+ transhydrogenase beta chain n=1 Tax=Pseudorhizobium halotolerans TaxID=1233081 RepID=A0ABN7K0W2_9HYPH|nr:NAD(P)+ transhydrogenase beta chain [Pseudorhizobium halotolerans]CAD7055367.1 NAD(P)+ transhydrogenase beta chain [Pseudorhizobium halotolerans]